jgi:hypothetical protein
LGAVLTGRLLLALTQVRNCAHSGDRSACRLWKNAQREHVSSDQVSARPTLDPTQLDLRQTAYRAEQRLRRDAMGTARASRVLQVGNWATGPLPAQFTKLQHDNSTPLQLIPSTHHAWSGVGLLIASLLDIQWQQHQLITSNSSHRTHLQLHSHLQLTPSTSTAVSRTCTVYRLLSTCCELGIL